jgi:hypothetical protein
VFTWWSLHVSGANEDALNELGKEIQKLPVTLCPAEGETKSDGCDSDLNESHES